MRRLIRFRLVPLITLLLVFAASPVLAQQTGGETPAVAQEQEQPRQIKVKILGMSCPFCAYGAEQKLKKLDGVKELKVELKSGISTLTMKEGADVPNERLKKTVEDAGFEASAILRTFPSDHEDWNPGKLPGGEDAGKPGSGAGSGQPAG